jgi:orotate phosphoribosyltransferase
LTVEQRIVAGLYEHGLFRTWYRHRPEGWNLVSGLWSPIYLQLRTLCGFPSLLAEVGRALAGLVRAEAPAANCLIGIAYGGIPIAISTSLAGGLPAGMTRKLSGPDADSPGRLPGYGQHASVEGALEEGAKVVLVDDLVTGFDSKLAAARQVEAEVARRNLERVECRDVAVVVDREQGGADAAAEHGFRLHALIRLRSEGLDWLEPVLAPIEYEVAKAYLEDPAPFQDEDEQARLREIALG